jgi:hypothetical protein
MSVLDDLREVEERLQARLQELRPALDEYAELEAAARRLGIDVDPRPTASASPRRTAKPQARRDSSAARVKPRRSRSKRRSGPRIQRRDQVLELVTARPGVTVPDIGKELGVDPTGLYRVVRQLEHEGTLRKDGMALHLARGT